MNGSTFLIRQFLLFYFSHEPFYEDNGLPLLNSKDLINQLCRLICNRRLDLQRKGWNKAVMHWKEFKLLSVKTSWRYSPLLTDFNYLLGSCSFGLKCYLFYCEYISRKSNCAIVYLNSLNMYYIMFKTVA